MAKTEAQAAEELRTMVDVDAEPALTPSEVSGILRRSARYGAWIANQEFEQGEVIAPTRKNGRLYKASQSGTTGATEPTFGAGYAGQWVAENEGSANAFFWIDAGPAPSQRWNLKKAAHQVCKLKESKAIAMVTSRASGQTFNWSDMAVGWRRLAASFRTGFIK